MSFERASVGGHTPVLHGTIPPQDEIPMGALIVTEVFGRTPPLPDGLPAIARALASFHALPVPSQADRFPLLSHDDPVAATLQVIEAQAKFLADADLEPEARLQIEEELINARKFAGDVSGRQMPITLVGSDTHPGNFILQPDGDAIFVDLEKVLYGSPAIDLAHATVYTSTMWDPDVAAALEKAEIAAFYDAYFGELPPALAQRIHPWCTPLRGDLVTDYYVNCAKWKGSVSANVPYQTIFSIPRTTFCLFKSVLMTILIQALSARFGLVLTTINLLRPLLTAPTSTALPLPNY